VLPYIIRRLAIGAVVLVVASFVVFLLVSLSGDPLAQLKANPHIPPAVIAQRERLLHLNESIFARYWIWVSHMFRGDFGNSIAGYPVGPILWGKLGVTLRLVVGATLLSVMFGVGLGVISARRQYSVVDYSATFASFVFFSTPVFVVGILLKQFLAVRVNLAAGKTLLYTLGQQSALLEPSFGSRLLDYTEHTILPVITLTLVTYPAWSRYQRAEMLDVQNSDYIRLARAKGLSPRRVLVRHILRNALIPVVTVIGLDTAAIFGGAVVTESVFGWNAMGQFLLTGIQQIDVNVVLAYLMLTAGIVILFNLLVDIIYGYLDPRIRHA